MRHLRWANQLLWTLAQRRLIRDRGPALEPGRKVPTVARRREFAPDSLLEQRRFELMVPPRTPAFRGRVRSAAVQQPGPSSHPTLRWRKSGSELAL